MRLSLFSICLLVCVSAVPAISISRWFSSTYHDLRFTLRRYGHCVGDLAPLKDHSMNETDFLIHQMRLFLDQAYYESDQMSNITQLMDSICRSDQETYPISVNIDINKYNGTAGKEARCRVIDEAMDSMYWVFKRAATNKSEPLDFSSILFYPNATDRNSTYNLTDLINTSWIKSDFQLDTVCKITESVKEYALNRTSKFGAQRRAEQQTDLFKRLVEFLDSLLDPILGAQKRLYWESTNRYEMLQSRIGNQLGNLRNGIGKGYKSTRDRITGLFVGSTNSTSAPATNGTSYNRTSSATRLGAADNRMLTSNSPAISSSTVAAPLAVVPSTSSSPATTSPSTTAASSVVFAA